MRFLFLKEANSVFFEAGVYGAVGIPVGLVAGILGLGGAFKVVNALIRSQSGEKVELSLVISAPSIVVVIGLAIITILISAYIPARKASKISAMEAIRQTRTFEKNEKKVRTLKLTRKVFGLEAELALKNIKRNCRRYRSIIFALVISIVLFLSVSSYLQYISSGYFMAKTTNNYDISVMLFEKDDQKNEDSNVIRERIISKIKASKNVSAVSATREVGAQIPGDQISSYLSKEMQAFLKENGIVDHASYQPYVTIIRVDEESFRTYCKQEKIDVDQVYGTKNGAVVLNRFETRSNYSVKQMPIFSFKGGEKIECYKNMDEKRGMFSFTVAATAVGRPMGIERYPDSVDKNLIVLLPDRNFDAMMKETNEEVFGTSNIYISTKEETVVEKELTTILREKKIKKEDYCLDNVAKNQKETRQLLYAVSIFAYGFIILMSLICCANMCNTISTSIALRRTEFAMLRSVGMTPKSFRKMIRFESLWYGVKAMLYGLPISSVIAYGLYLYVGERFTVSYFLPWYIYGLVVVLVFGVIGIVMFWSSKKVRNDNIVDGLRMERQ